MLLGFVQQRLDKLGTDDFTVFWAGPRALLAGVDPYDPVTWRANAVRLGSLAYDTDVYPYPPWVALALTPLALLPLRTAALLWTVGGFAMAAIAVRGLLRSYLPDLAWAHGVVAIVLTVSEPAVSTLLLGQWTFVLLAAVCGVVLLLRQKRPVAAGVLTLVMLAKPPLFVFTGAALVVRALWPGSPTPRVGRRFVMSAVGAGVATVALSWTLVPSWWPAWLVHSAAVLVGIQPVSLPTLFITLFGPNGVWLAPPVLLAVTFVALQFHPRGDGWLPVGLTLSNVGVIYSNTYDILLLIVPLVLAAGTLTVHRRQRAAVVVLLLGAGLLFVVMWSLQATYARGYAAGISLLMFAVIAVALWPDRREIPSSESQ